MSELDEIKDSIDIVDLIRETVDLKDCGGDEWKGALNTGSQSGKSLVVNRGMQVWHDWPSNTGGTVLDWIAHANNLDINTEFRQVLAIAAEKAGIQLDTNCNYDSTPEIFTILRAAAQWYNDQLTTEHRTHIKDKWGISDKTIDKYLIGYAPSTAGLQSALSEVFTVEDIRASGLFNSTEKGWISLYQDRIVFPYWLNEHIVYSIARAMAEGDDRKYIKHLTKNEKHKYVAQSIKNVIYGQDSLKGADHCIITEGVTDCLMGLQAGIPCVSPVTTRFQEDDHTHILELVKDLKTVYICNDSEVSREGAKGAKATADILISKGIDVRIIQLPKPDGIDKIDLADFLRDNPVDAFKELMKGAEVHTGGAPAKSCKVCRYYREGTNDKGVEWARCALLDDWLNPYTAIACDKWEDPPEATDTQAGAITGQKFNAKTLGDTILSNHHIITLADTRQMLLYVDGVYKSEAEDTIRNICMDLLDYDFKKHSANETIEYIRLNTLTDRDEMNTHTYIINVRNGMYDVVNDKLLAHDPKYKSAIQLNVLYDVKAECPAIDKYLYEVTDIDLVPLLYQYIGYCLTTDTSQHKSLLIDGGTSNGKSVFIDLVLALVGKKHTSMQSIQRLNSNRFATAALDGKLLNVFTDLPSARLQDNATFKQVTGDKIISAEIKQGKCYEFRNITRHIYSANKLPELTDEDEMSFFRRLLCVTFPNTFEGDAIDRHLLDKLTTETELTGLFNIALIGLKALMKHDVFCYNPSVEHIQQTYLIKSDPVRYFLDTCTERGNEPTIKTDLHKAYTAWCKISKPTSVLSNNAFGRKMKDLGYTDGRPNEKPRPWGWINLSLTDEFKIWFDFGKDSQACPGYDKDNKSCQGSVKDNNKTLTKENKPSDTDNKSSCQGGKVISQSIEYNKIYNNMYGATGTIENVGEQVNNNLTTLTEPDNKEGNHKQEAPDKPVKDNIKPCQNLDKHDHNLDRKDTQADRLNKLKAAVERFEKFKQCVLSEHNYKDCASEYIRMNPDQDYEQVLTDLRHGWKIEDKDNKTQSGAYGEIVTVEALQDIPEVIHPTGEKTSVSKGDVIQLNKLTAQALTQRNMVKVVS